MSPVFRVAPFSKLYILLDCEIGLAKEVCVCVCVYGGVSLYSEAATRGASYSFQKPGG